MNDEMGKKKLIGKCQPGEMRESVWSSHPDQQFGVNSKDKGILIYGRKKIDTSSTLNLNVNNLKK